MKLSASYVFDTELNLGNYAKHIIANYEDNKITKDNLGIEYEIFKSMRNVPMLHDVIKLFEIGRIRFAFTQTPNNILPFIPFKEGDKSICIVNVTPFVLKVEESIYTIDAKTIYGLLMSAMGVLVAFDTGCFIGNARGKEFLVSLYADMIIKVLNRVSNVATNDDNSLFVKYIITYWVLCRHNMVNFKDACGYAMKISKCGDLNKITSFNMKFPETLIAEQGINEFIENVMKSEFKFSMDKINLPYMIKSYASVFGSMCTLGLDYMPYIAGVAMSYYADYGIYKNKIFAKELNKEMRECATILYPIIENRIKLW